MLKASRLEQDPTKQSGNRLKCIAEIKKRLNGARGEINDLYRDIDKTLVKNRVTYVYEMDETRLAQTAARIREIVDSWFQTDGDIKPRIHFMDKYIRFAHNMATADSLDRIGLLMSASNDFTDFEISQVDAERIMQTPLYFKRVSLVYGRAFNEMKGFSGDLATGLARVLSDVVASNQGVKAAISRIKKEFDTSKSRAERIARTEINRAYTGAKIESAKDVQTRLDIQVRFIHRSSLMPTTRLTHGRRHGNIYTAQEQEDWWNEGTNRINCLCSVSETILNKQGEVMDKRLIERLQKQKDAWFPTS